jgi:Fe-S-cluster containining protein
MGTLLPGEEEYMAKEMGISVYEFEVRFLDVLKFADGTKLFLLKLERLCPFLNEETKVCECRNFKPVFCKVYPVVFTVEAGEIKFTLDNWCELSRKKAFRHYFEKSIPLLSSLPIPREWFMYVASYDNFCFDYNQLKKYRNGEKIKTFLLEEILSSEKANIET